MKFFPLGDIQISIWETRVQDYEAVGVDENRAARIVAVGPAKRFVILYARFPDRNLNVAKRKELHA